MEQSNDEDIIKKYDVKEINCPQCKNQDPAKKNCIVCRGTGKVKTGK